MFFKAFHDSYFFIKSNRGKPESKTKFDVLLNRNLSIIKAMRTGNNLVIGEGVQAFADFVSKNYRGATVGIIFDADIDPIVKAFGRNGNGVSCIKAGDCKSPGFPPGIRYIVGVGGERCARLAREAARDGKRYSLYCTGLFAEAFFSKSKSSELEEKYAECVYFDRSIIDITDTEKLISGTLNLISLLSALLDYAGRYVLSPYKDTHLVRLISEIKKFLLEKSDVENYLQSISKLMAAASEYCCKHGLEPMAFALKRRLKRGIREGTEFFLAYLSFYFAIIFTKWDFFDMLIPAKNLSCIKPGLERLLLANPGEISSLFFSREELKRLASVFMGMGGSISGDEVSEVFDVFSEELSKTQGFYAVINNMGLVEGVLQNERFKAY